MSINIKRTLHPTDIAKDTEKLFIEETMERYGTPLEVIKQKRAMINNIYYSADREQIFFEQMGRHTTFDSLPEPEQDSAKVTPKLTTGPATPIQPTPINPDNTIKSIFDF
ncbi:MAG: hypothetical protein WA057_04500 [Candidatus Magasanikiibacteriota bacterium]